MKNNLEYSPLVVGLVGKIGVGKSSAVEEFLRLSLLSQPPFRFESIRISEILQQEILRKGLPDIRTNYAVVHESLGDQALNSRLRDRIMSSTAEGVLLDGIRGVRYDFLRSFSHNRLIYIASSDEKRFSNFLDRRKAGDPVNLEELKKWETTNEQELSIPEIIRDPDKIVIVNNGSIEDFYSRVREVYCEITGTHI